MHGTPIQSEKPHECRKGTNFKRLEKGKNFGEGAIKRMRSTCLSATIAMGSVFAMSTFNTNLVVSAHPEQQHTRSISEQTSKYTAKHRKRKLSSTVDNDFLDDSDSSHRLPSKAHYITQSSRKDESILNNPCITVHQRFQITEENPDGYIEDVIEVAARCMFWNGYSGADLIDFPTDSPAPTPSPSIGPTSFPTSSIIPTVVPTPGPTDTIAPSPAPSRNPSLTPLTQSPTHNPSPQPTPEPTPIPTMRPTPDPTPLPSYRPTPFPTIKRTSQPTPQPSPLPTRRTARPTSKPTRFPTPLPTSSPTPLPTSLPTLQPTSSPTTLQPTPSPTTLQPTSPPTQLPTQVPTTTPVSVPILPNIPVRTLAPTYYLSNEPTLSPASSTNTEGPIFNFNFLPSMFVSSPSPSQGPSSSFEPFMTMRSNNVAISPFSLNLGFPSTMNSSQLDSLGNELENILPDYLSQKSTSLENTYITEFLLNVTIQESVDRRWLQENTDYTFDISGSVDVDTPESEAIDPEDIAESIDSTISEAFDESNVDAFSDFISSHPDSNFLKSASDISVKKRQPVNSIEMYSEENAKKKPTPVAIFFGFLLVALMLLSLVFYAYHFYKRWKRLRAQKRRERQGVYATVPPKHIETEEQARQLAAINQINSNNAITRDDSSDSSSYSGINDETTSKADSFARELENAVSRDKRDWQTYQSRKQSLSSKPKPMVMDDDESGCGFEITDAESTLIFGPTTNADESFQSIISENAFPHGDEEDQFIPPERSVFGEGTTISGTSRSSVDPPGPRSSSVRLHQRQIDDPTRGNESQLPASDNQDATSLTPSKMLQNTALTRRISMLSAQQAPEDDYDTDSLLSQGLESKSHDSAAVATLLDRLTAKKKEISGRQDHDSNTSSRFQETSVGSHRQSTQSNDKDEEEMSNNDSQSKSQSLLTVDIVNEVKKLSAYVKRYETKRENKQKKKLKRSTDKEASVSTNGMTYRDSDSESSSSSDSDSSIDMQSPLSSLHLAKLADEESSSSSSDSENGKPMFGSDDSRLGIFPFPDTSGPAKVDNDSFKQRIASRESSNNPELSHKPASVPRPRPHRLSKPPVTGDALTSTALSPIPATPDGKEANNRNLGRSLLEGILGKKSRQTSPEKEDSSNGSNIPVLRAPPRDSPLRSKGSPSRKQKFSFQLMDSQKGNTPEQGVSEAASVKNKSLDEMRHKDGSIIDSEDSNNSSKDYSDKENGRSKSSVIESKPLKSKNKGFNKIISMFEAKPREAIFPPNESWQYNY